jgi:hypothetical protein
MGILIIYDSPQNVIKEEWIAAICNIQGIQGGPGGKVNILEGHDIGDSKQKYVYVHASYSERFPR